MLKLIRINSHYHSITRKNGMNMSLAEAKLLARQDVHEQLPSSTIARQPEQPCTHIQALHPISYCAQF